MKKTMLLLALCAMIVGCVSDINPNPLVGNRYVSKEYNGHNAFTFTEKQYFWYEDGHENPYESWRGYYTLKNNIIYCYFDKQKRELDWEMKYCVDSIIWDDETFYKQ